MNAVEVLVDDDVAVEVDDEETVDGALSIEIAERLIVLAVRVVNDIVSLAFVRFCLFRMWED